MTPIPIRTSLSRADSGFTDEEKADRMARLERRLWIDHAAVVVRMSDPGMAIVVEALGIQRFGKREERA